MPLLDMVIHSKLAIPQPLKPVFQRDRLRQLLGESFQYPLTIVQGGTGFGKTTALAELANQYPARYWYNITEQDRDPALFLAHLISAFLPLTQPLLDLVEQEALYLSDTVVNRLINLLTLELDEEAVIVLDDLHLVQEMGGIMRWLEQIIDQRPPRLHIAIGTRRTPDLPALVRWRVKGSALVINQQQLAFNSGEIRELFSKHHQYEISLQQADDLFDYTDGWIIALEMIWQRLQYSRSKKLENVLDELPAALTDIFNFLAQEVLMRQTELVQLFLKVTSVLRAMEGKVCDHMTGSSGSLEVLSGLSESGLFITATGGRYFHYQRLFQDFLCDQVRKVPGWDRKLHARAAEYYSSAGNTEEAIYHLLQAGNRQAAAQQVVSLGKGLIETGRTNTLRMWLDQMAEEKEKFPELYILEGDIHRLRSEFEAALGSYRIAEQYFTATMDNHRKSLALQGQAQVYLDTVRPNEAADLLQAAMALIEPHEYPLEAAEMMDRIAENEINQGNIEEARKLQEEAAQLRADQAPQDVYLEGRALLRSGRLHEASGLLRAAYAPGESVNKTAARPQRFHRETSLLLALIHLMLGDIAEGEKYSRLGIDTGHRLESSFVEAVGLMRLGHALQLKSNAGWQLSSYKQALECYRQSLELVRPFNVVRVQVEPLWGLCRLHGFHSEIDKAAEFAQQAIAISESSGDHWFVALLRTTMGESYLLDGNFDQAKNYLAEALRGFEMVGDRFGELAVRTADILAEWRLGSRFNSLKSLADLLPDLESSGYGYLLSKPSLLGMQDMDVFLPVLVEANQQGLKSNILSDYLEGKKLKEATSHPGYSLNIRTLGPFEVYRGSDPVAPREWQREKARQLLQVFLTRRTKWHSREQLADMLWPDLDADAALRNLKVALNALNNALEPGRESGSSPFFVVRRDNLYALNPAAGIRTDADDFMSLAASGERENILAAMQLFRGEFLADCPDEPWLAGMRLELHNMYVRSGLVLMRSFYNDKDYQTAMKTARDVLVFEPACEEAYCVIMECHAAEGDRAAVRAVYQKCLTALDRELGSEPSPQTVRLYGQLIK